MSADRLVLEDSDLTLALRAGRRGTGVSAVLDEHDLVHAQFLPELLAPATTIIDLRR